MCQMRLLEQFFGQGFQLLYLYHGMELAPSSVPQAFFDILKITIQVDLFLCIYSALVFMNHGRSGIARNKAILCR